MEINWPITYKDFWSQIFSLSGKIQVCWTVGGIFYCSRFHSGKYGGTSFSSHSMEYYFRTRLVSLDYLHLKGNLIFGYLLPT